MSATETPPKPKSPRSDVADGAVLAQVEKWMAMIRELIEEARSDTPSHRSGDWRKPFDSGGPFEPLNLETFRHVQTLPRADAVDVFASRSYVAALPESERSHLLEVPRSEMVDIPYITELDWTRKST